MLGAVSREPSMGRYWGALWTTLASMDCPSPSNPRGNDMVTQVRWLIRLRWIAVAGMVLGALVASLAEAFGVDPYPVIVLAAILASLNAFASWLTQHAGTGGERWQRGFIRGQILLDLVALAFLTTLTGGTYSHSRPTTSSISSSPASSSRRARATRPPAWHPLLC